MGLEINKNEDEDLEIQNVGNVKINITKTDEGITVGYIRLGPTETEEILDEGLYTGRQDNG